MPFQNSTSGMMVLYLESPMPFRSFRSLHHSAKTEPQLMSSAPRDFRSNAVGSIAEFEECYAVDCAAFRSGALDVLFIERPLRQQKWYDNPNDQPADQ